MEGLSPWSVDKVKWMWVSAVCHVSLVAARAQATGAEQCCAESPDQLPAALPSLDLGQLLQRWAAPEFVRLGARLW